MKKICLLLATFCLPVFAADEDLKALGIKFIDDKGCYLKFEYPNGSDSGELQTINMMLAGLDGDFLKKDRRIEILKKAIDAGCDINELHHGASPLNSAILFVQTDMVYLLLSKGANPEVKVSSAGRLNGMNAYELADFLAKKNPEDKDRLDIKKILEDFRKDKS